MCEDVPSQVVVLSALGHEYEDVCKHVGNQMEAWFSPECSSKNMGCHCFYICVGVTPATMLKPDIQKKNYNMGTVRVVN